MNDRKCNTFTLEFVKYILTALVKRLKHMKTDTDMRSITSTSTINIIFGINSGHVYSSEVVYFNGIEHVQ